MLNKNHNNKIGHNSLSDNNSKNKDLKTTKKGFFVNYNEEGFRIDHYNTTPLRRLIRKGLIKLGLFEYIKNVKKRLMVKYVWKKQVKNIIENLTKTKLPLFDTISIETFSKCNGGCSFCPVNRFDDPRNDVLMSESLFKKIILNLYDLNYKGQVILSLNNEPFLDKRIYDFAKIARAYLPDAYISILTNGTPLNIERFERIINNVDELLIDNYNDNLEWHKNVKTIMEHMSDKEIYKDKVKFRMRLENDVLDTRAGQANNRGWIKTLDISCVYPFLGINIQVNGDVALCCNDALAKELVGNVANKNLEDVWFSKKYFDYRNKINSSRKLVPICEGCDTVDIPRRISKAKVATT